VANAFLVSRAQKTRSVAACVDEYSPVSAEQKLKIEEYVIVSESSLLYVTGTVYVVSY